MTKKELLTPILFAGIGLAFVFISLMVWFSNGKSAKWVARKMKVGALLLSLNATVSCEQFVTTCYDMPAPPNTMQIIESDGYMIEIQPDTGNVLNGYIYQRVGTDFSFAVIAENDVFAQKGTILAADGQFDYYQENFKIELDTSLIPGNFTLHLYDVKLQNQSDAVPKQQYQLLIK